MLSEFWILTHLRNDKTNNTYIPSTQLFGALEYLLTDHPLRIEHVGTSALTINSVFEMDDLCNLA